MARRLGALLAASLASACSNLPTQAVDVRVDRAAPTDRAVESARVAYDAAAASTRTVETGCGRGRAMTVHFYDVGQALAVLVDLPDGRHVLVDAADSPRRAGCGAECEAASRHLLAALAGDLHGAPIDLLFITHQHSDHLGGAPHVLDTFKVGVYADNDRDLAKDEVRRAHRAAERHDAAIRVVDPDHAEAPLTGAPGLKLTAIVPPRWPASCAHDPNECSVGLRIDFCAWTTHSYQAVHLAETDEQTLLDPRGAVTLLQVAHHGSDTSTTPAFLAKIHPKYAVISAGKPGVGLNREYCHPRALIVERLTRVLGGRIGKALAAFDGEQCGRAQPAEWVAVPAAENLWATERDGDVVLTTSGDGTFVRRAP